MIRNFFVIAFRNLRRNKGFSALNICGLAIGMASAMIILLWVQSELRYDSRYPNSDRLYQAWNRDRNSQGINCWNNTSKIMGPTLKKDYPEVEQITRVNWNTTYLFKTGDKKLNATGTMVDPDFLTMFDFPFLKGSKHAALNHPGDIVITQKLSKKLFGDEEAMGRTVRVDNQFNFTVSGVLKDLPTDTQFDFEYLLPWSHMQTIHEDDSSWGRNSTHNFVLLRQHADVNAFNAKIRRITINHGERDWTTEAFLYPVSKLHLFSNFENGIPSGGKIQTVRVFTMVAIFILLIACINFMNMSTARSERRAKEVGIRKVAGAGRPSLILGFIAESMLITFMAGAIALLLVQFSLVSFNELTQKHLYIDFFSPLFWLSFLGFMLITGLLAGSYPAFFMSAFKPVTVLKGSFKKVESALSPRKMLVVVQFSFAIILIISTIIVEKQVRYGMDREAGYNRDKLVYIFLSGDINRNYDIIRNELMRQGIATSITKTSAPLTEGWSSGGAEWDGKDPNLKAEFNFFNTDGHIVETAGLQLVKGRDIDPKKYISDSNAVIVNEAAVLVMGMKDPIGKTINKNFFDTDWHIVGVVKDFILQSPYDPVKPIIIQGLKSNWFNLIHIKLNPAKSTAENIAAMEKIFKQYNPEYPFEYKFLDEQYAKKFRDDQTTGTLSALFAGLTILISCLGLFGLAAYMAEKRVKEIGVRKVLGATVLNITTLLSADFVKLVLVAVFIAAPVAWIFMDKWLAGYNYHISIQPWVFLLAGALALLIALATVSFQAIRAAIANPVKSLRNE